MSDFINNPITELTKLYYKQEADIRGLQGDKDRLMLIIARQSLTIDRLALSEQNFFEICDERSAKIRELEKTLK